MLKKFLNSKTAILAISISFTITLFIGSFANAPLTMDKSFSGKYWYYINRGYPEAWAGVALSNSKVDFPLVKMPFISLKDDRGTELVKIINLNTFFPLLMLIFFVSYIPSFILAKAVDENRKLYPFLVSVAVIILLIGVAIYFSSFSNV